MSRKDFDSVSLSTSISKIDEQEAMSLTYASLREAAERQEDSITTERLIRNNTILGIYKVMSDPISGGMGSVWRIHHEGWNVDMALKRPKPRYFAEGGEARKKNFIKECENWIRLRLHPNIVSCYYVREIGGVPSVFSEWMDGGSLKDRIRDGSLYAGTEEEVQKRILDIAIQGARGLMYSHRNALLHMDIKPGNILLTKDWDAKVGDFGLANSKKEWANPKIFDSSISLFNGPEAIARKKEIDELRADYERRFPESAARNKARLLIPEEERMGYTPEYCPHEQAIGERPARWMDVYAWALTVLEMYAGERLWEKGEEAAGKCETYLAQCRYAVPDSMKKVIVPCLTQKLNGFTGVLMRLNKIYEEVTGSKYTRKDIQRAASDTADSLNNRALSYLDLGMPQEAEKLWEEALLHSHDHADTLFNRELYLVRTGRKTCAQAMEVLNNYRSTRDIGAADMIAPECGDTGTETDRDKNGRQGTPLPIPQKDAQPAMWRVSHILTSQRRIWEDERIRTLLEEFEVASDDDTDRCIEIYHEAGKIEGFNFTEEADYMMEWLDEYAERTAILEMRSLGILDEMPTVSGEAFSVHDCYHGWKAFILHDGGHRMIIYDEDLQLVRDLPLPEYKAEVRWNRIYAFMDPMQWAALNLWGHPVETPKGGWPPKWERGRNSEIRYDFCDLDSEGKKALFTVSNLNNPEIGGTFLLEMSSGKILRLSEKKEEAAFVKDDTIVLVSEKGIRRFEAVHGNMIGKIAQTPGTEIHGLKTSQERERFLVRSGGCILTYDMELEFVGRCDLSGEKLHWMPGGHFIKDRDTIWNISENKVELAIREPGIISDSGYRRITVSPDGRELYAEKFSSDEPGEVIGYRLVYDYRRRDDEVLPTDDDGETGGGESGAEGLSAVEGGSGKAGLFASLLRWFKPDRQPEKADLKARQKEEADLKARLYSVEAFAKENHQLDEMRRRHAVEDKKLEKFLKDPRI